VLFEGNPRFRIPDYGFTKRAGSLHRSKEPAYTHAAVPDPLQPGICNQGFLGTEDEALATYRSFEDLPVWQKAMDLADALFDVAETEAFARRYSLRDSELKGQRHFGAKEKAAKLTEREREAFDAKAAEMVRQAREREKARRAEHGKA